MTYKPDPRLLVLEQERYVKIRPLSNYQLLVNLDAVDPIRLALISWRAENKELIESLAVAIYEADWNGFDVTWEEAHPVEREVGLARAKAVVEVLRKLA